MPPSASNGSVRMLSERIMPHFNECGVVSFVLFACCEDAEGNIRRVAFGSPPAPTEVQPPHVQAMIPLIAVASQWGQERD